MVKARLKTTGLYGINGHLWSIILVTVVTLKLRFEKVPGVHHSRAFSLFKSTNSHEDVAPGWRYPRGCRHLLSVCEKCRQSQDSHKTIKTRMRHLSFAMLVTVVTSTSEASFSF